METKKDIIQLFENPGAEYRGKPFWSWNGELRKEELLRQLSIIKEMGFGGFFMHSRAGLITEYLGEEWFELVNAVADEGEKLGLEAERKRRRKSNRRSAVSDEINGHVLLRSQCI
mgnify:CR=1 FL=1